MSQSRMLAIVTNSKDFSGAEVRVILWYILQSPGHGDAVRKTGRQIAAELDMTPEGYSRIVTRLRKRRILLERDKVGVTKFYAINPYLGGRGAGADQREAVAGCNPPELPGHEIKPADITPATRPGRIRRTA
ncbi:MarR family transcriptional regulator [Streptomyces sp. NPDC017941]|uniref:MarR family transcriptional regulator n=1 Tax=Streptomyces sp. NPDC017941 TaxID=3365018 RepID=UPI00379B33BF